MRGSREISLVPSLHRASTDALMRYYRAHMILSPLAPFIVFFAWANQRRHQCCIHRTVRFLSGVVLYDSYSTLLLSCIYSKAVHALA